MSQNYLAKENPGQGNKYILYLIFYFLLYVILFEFVLPVNDFLPKPSLIPDTLFSIIAHYNFASNLLLTISSVYISMMVGSFLFFLVSVWLTRLLIDNKEFIRSVEAFHFLPAAGFISLLVLWIPSQVVYEYLMGTVFTLIILFGELQREIPRIKNEYIEPLLAIKVPKIEIFRIISKLTQPGVIRHMEKVNYLLWSWMLVFELIKGFSGLGGIYHECLLNRDFSAVFVLSLIVWLLVALSHYLIKKLIQKLITWEAE